MQWKQTYLDLCEEIEALEARAEELSEQLQVAYKTCYDGKMPGDSFSRLPLDKAVEAYDTVAEKLSRINSWLEAKKETKERMEKSVGNMTSIENQVAYRRTIMRQSHRQIANELGYSEGYVRVVYHRIMRDEEDRRKVTFL